VGHEPGKLTIKRVCVLSNCSLYCLIHRHINAQVI